MILENNKLHQELLLYFKDFLDQSDKSEPTKQNLLRDIRAYLKFLLDREDAIISSSNVISYINFLNEKYNEASFVTKSSSIRQFINWLNLDNNPFWDLKMSVSYDDYETYDRKDFYQDDFEIEIFILALYYELYLSVDEFLSLNLRNYNHASASFDIAGRRVKLSERLNQAAKIYLQQRREILAEVVNIESLDQPFLILPQTKDIFDLQVEDFRLKANQLSDIAFSQRKKLTLIKRSRVIHLLDEGNSISQVEEILDTELSSFFEKFVQKEDYRLLSAYNKFHPRARFK